MIDAPAEIVDYPSLIAALRQRFAELHIATGGETTNMVAGLPDKYI